MERTERRWTLLLALEDALTVFLLLAGGLAAFLPVNRFFVDTGFLLAWCALFAAIAAALYAWRWGGWTALGLLAVEGLALWRFWENLRFASWLRGVRLTDAAVEFLLLAFALALGLGWVVIRARCWYLAALAVTVPLLPAITRGVLPDWTALTAAAAGWGTLLLSALYSRRSRSNLAKGNLLSLVGITGLLLLLNAVLPQEGYRRPQWATDARDDLLTAAAGQLAGLDWAPPDFLEEYLSLENIGGGFGAGKGGFLAAGIAVERDGGVDLLDAGPRSYAGRRLMEITGAQPGAGYLLGGSAAVYTGDSWEKAAAGPEGLSSLPDLFPAQAVPAPPEEVMTIRCAYTGAAAFYPYRLCGFPDGNVTLAGGAAGKRRSLQEYRASYRPGGPYGGYVPLEGDAAQEEGLYRDFVYHNYLDVPPAAWEALIPLRERMFLVYAAGDEIPVQWQVALSSAQQAARVLHEAAGYDLDTPAMELGEDFVAQFLEEGRGYCVHFATAGAMLLRMMGVPARYASGYVFQADSQGNASVWDSSAHAWVEVYLDGYGWHPVEMTPAAGFPGSGGPSPDGAETPGAGPGVESPDEPEIPEEPESPDVPETPGGEEPSEPEEPPPPDVQAPETPGGEEPSEPAVKAAPLDLRPLGWAALAGLALCTPFALYRLGLSLRRRRREQPDANRSVIAAYCRYRRLAAWGGAEDAALETLARKAKFSQHTLTDQEREAAWAGLEDGVRRLDGAQPWWKRAAFRCLRPLF